MAARMRLAQRQGLLPSHLYPALPPLPPLFSAYYPTGLHPNSHTGGAGHQLNMSPHLASALTHSESVFSTAHSSAT